MKVYLAMPINTASGYDPQWMFEEVGQRMTEYGLEPILPSNGVDPAVWEGWMREYLFAECCLMLVESDQSNLREADAIIAFMPNASIGTAMEIAYARMWHKKVVVVTSIKTFYHPWLWYHADRVIWSDDPFGEGLSRACEVRQSL